MSIVVSAAVWILALVCLVIASSTYDKQMEDGISEAAFAESAEIIQNEDRVGADIWLKQEIHGTEGVKYRYVIKTECPRWNFETRYMSDAPIEWVTDETSAVEVLIFDIQIRYMGTVYASGQYYTVPILGGISSEDISRGAWEERLMKQAYQTYLAEGGINSDLSCILKILLFGIPVVMFIWIGLSETLRIGGRHEKLSFDDTNERLVSMINELRNGNTDLSSDNQSGEKKK